MSGQFTVVGLGELLWDMFPQGKQLGGAPGNFAYMTALLGDRGIVASRVGGDRLGQEAMWQLKSSGLDTSHIQTDSERATGTVLVKVDSKGQPEYRICEDVAWDHLEWTADWQDLAIMSDAVCFGSLAQRSEAARLTIRKFLQSVRADAARIFDVNLRQAFFSAEILRVALLHANIMKVNHEELPRMIELFGEKFSGEKESACWLGKEFGVKLVCVTRGHRGSLLVCGEKIDEHPGFRVKVADTVGAGDAFTAALVHHWLRKAPLPEINIAANRLGAWVASQEGAMPSADESVLSAIR
ncbi:MAG TPA: carbohydrate kinase [Candidatus Acidoferrum sp.]|nr:carbohydrate kinase [Candidatus Acidoferrum sp.]